MSTTIKDVAKACGVSTATVSRAFTENSVIKPETRARILQMAESMNYSPNFMASALKSARTRTIGFVVPSIRNSFYIDFLVELESIVHSAGYRILTSFMQPGIEEKDAVLAMTVSRPEGMIIFPTGQSNTDLYKSISKNTELLQIFNCPYPEYDQIRLDDYLGVQMAIEHLVKNGHKNILLTAHDYDLNRQNSFRDTMRAKKLPFTEENMVIIHQDDDPNNITMISERIQKLKPTAILSIARTGEYAWSTLHHMGLRVPEDISFIAYDDVNWVRMMDITAVAHPLHEIASMAVRHLIEKIENPTPKKKNKTPVIYIMTPHLTERSSVKNIGEAL